MVIVAVALFGLLWGSFANVLIARVPQGQEWVKSSSRCPRCGVSIAWYDNIPVVSWLVLRAKCRSCREPIAVRYVVVEVLTSVAFVAVYLQWGVSIAALAFAYLAFISVVLVFIDLDVQRLPDSLVGPAYAVGVVLLSASALLEFSPWALARAALGALILGGGYGLLRLAYPPGMGLGDVKTAGLLGMHAGFLGWSQLALAGFAGPIIGGVVVLVGLAVGVLNRKSRVPYGPALILGAWVGIFAGQWVVAAYLDAVLGGG